MSVAQFMLIVLLILSNILSNIKLLLHLYASAVLFYPRETKEYLSGEPFAEFLESMYFKRYLQWKWLEL